MVYALRGVDVGPTFWGSLEWGVGVKYCAKYVGCGVSVKGVEVG